MGKSYLPTLPYIAFKNQKSYHVGEAVAWLGGALRRLSSRVGDDLGINRLAHYYIIVRRCRQGLEMLPCTRSVWYQIKLVFCCLLVFF